ncbi:MAG: FHA domain-containing protein [Solirubrobacteraceae bacterium]|nr:FHA domain-containing protein [Solirubrobacteraceae bacterium]
MRVRDADGTSAAQGLKLVLDAERQGLPFLRLSAADGRTRLAVLEDGDERLTVGRASACDVVIDHDPGVSRVHCEIERVADGWVVSDDGLSRNGTVVDDRRLEGRHRLHEGSIMRVGATTIEFRNPTEGHTQAPTRTIGIGALPPAVTPAQVSVLRELCRPMIVEGAGAPAGNQVIAETLFLSVETVKSHLKVLYGRFDLEDVPAASKRTELATRVIRAGIVRKADLL